MRNKRNFQVKCYLSKDELNTIKDNAKAYDLKVSAYIRERALNPNIVNCTYDEIEAHIKELVLHREKINRVSHTIYKTIEYVPSNIDYILEEMKKILRSKKSLFT